MPQRLHTFLFVAFTFVGAAVGAMLYRNINQSYGLQGWHGDIVFFAVIWFCANIPYSLFSGLIAARCPRCRRMMKVTGTRPIAYACTECDYRHESSVSFGKGGRGGKPLPPWRPHGRGTE
jgi:hypothetical protein